MYKIMYRIINENNNDFCFVGHRNEKDEYIIDEYATANEAKEAAKPIIHKIGANDVRIIEDEDYYLKVIMGERPEPIKDTYSLVLSSSYDVNINPDNFENITKGTDLFSFITFPYAGAQFHLIVDGQEAQLGFLNWIEYNSITDVLGKLTFRNIDANHEIVVVIDGYTTA